MSEPEGVKAPATPPPRVGNLKDHYAPDTEAAFRLFFLRNRNSLITYLHLNGLSISDADDVAQDAMWLAYNNWEKISHPKSWLFRVANRMVTKKGLGNREATVEYPLEIEARRGTSNIDSWENKDEALTAIAHLPPKQREVITRHMAGFETSEIADDLEMTYEAVKDRLYAARKSLKEHLFGKEDEDEKP
jgi:RNA polymerase sigma factor (sigma-70 family)